MFTGSGSTDTVSERGFDATQKDTHCLTGVLASFGHRRGHGYGSTHAQSSGSAGRRGAVFSVLLFALACGAPRSEPVVMPATQWQDAFAAYATAVDSTVTSSVVSGGAPVDASLRIGPNDVLGVRILEAPELDREVRVDGTGHVSLPLLGEVVAAGLTPRELELSLEASLRERFIRDPHVSVQINEMQSAAVAVVGAVARPGVFQIREARPLLEMIALAGGLAPDAGENVIIVRGRPALPPPGSLNGSNGANGSNGEAGLPARVSVTVNLRALLESQGAHDQVSVMPGDQVKVTPAGVIYVVGEVNNPGAFPAADGPSLTILRAIAVAEGFAPNAARGSARIIRTDSMGVRSEMEVDLRDVLAGKAADVELQPQDVVFVPSSRTRTVTLGVVDALVRMVTFRGIVR